LLPTRLRAGPAKVNCLGRILAVEYGSEPAVLQCRTAVHLWNAPMRALSLLY
jgi:hypothetical protein